MSASEDRRRRVAIIGAGVSGLPSARWALAYDIEPVVFEKTNSIGGIWRYAPDETDVGSVMQTTVANTSKEMSAYSDFPPYESHSVFMRNAEMLQYLEEYAHHHDLYQHIRLRHTVTSVARAPDYDRTGKWTVEYYSNREEHHHQEPPSAEDHQSRSEETFDAVLLCYGTSRPNRDSMTRANSERFCGRILHACQVKNTLGFENTVNVVVGFGPSAADIASELGRVAKKVYLSTRSGGRILVRCGHPDGEPLDMAVSRRVNKYFWPRVARASLLERAFLRQYQAHLDHAKCGLIASKGESLFARGVTISDDLASRISSGAVLIRPDIAAFTAKGVLWAGDGDGVEGVDNVIFATGYDFHTDLVEGGALVPAEDHHHANLYKAMFPPRLADHNTLAFISTQRIFGPISQAVELKARVFFESFAGALRLPSRDEMTRVVAAERAKVLDACRRGASMRAATTQDGILFSDELAQMIGCAPAILRTALTDPRLAYALAFAPSVAYVYRLRGAHAWPGARDAILGVRERVDAALRRPCAPGGDALASDATAFSRKIWLFCEIVAGMAALAALFRLYIDA